MKIEQAVLRGVESFGMLCSAHECGWVSQPGGSSSLQQPFAGGAYHCLLQRMHPAWATC